MIKTELEWHSNKKIPESSMKESSFLVATNYGNIGIWLVAGAYTGEKFTNFYHFDAGIFRMEEVSMWASLSQTQSQLNDLVTDCACGDTTPHEPWEPECGLGKSEEHCREVSEEPMGIGYYLRGIQNKKRQEQEERAAQFLLDAIQEVKQALTGEEYLVPDGFGKGYCGKIDGAMKLLNEAYTNIEGEPEEDNSFIVANMAQCALCKDVIESHSRHDFKMCSCDSVGVDGGMAYIRRFGERENIIEMSVYSTDDYELIRTHFKRGSRGVKGDDPLTWITLKDMTSEHLRAVLDYDKVNKIISPYTELYQRELEYRGEWK